MGEETILQEGGVTVTTARVIIGGTTYSLRNITSVKTTFTPPNTGCAVGLMIIGGLITVAGIASFQADIGQGLMGLACSGVFIAAGFFWFKSLKNDYHVVFASSSGEAQALTSKDRAFVDRVVASINDAIARG